MTTGPNWNDPGAEGHGPYEAPKRSVGPGLLIGGIVGLVAILFLLMLGMMFMSRAGETEHANTCRNNLRNVGLAIVMYESQHNRYPGYVDTIATEGGQQFSRPLMYMVMPNLERNDVFEAYHASRHPSDGLPESLHGAFELFHCPSDPRAISPNSYVYNTGMPDVATASPPDWPANGVFHAHHPAIADSPAPPPIDFDFVMMHDGTTMTLLASENLDAGPWMSMKEEEIGFLFSPKFADRPAACINGETDLGDPPAPTTARPSSRHPGIVNVAFCDGHVRTIGEHLDYIVYAALLTPHGAEAGYPGAERKPLEEEYRTYILRSDDLDAGR